MTDDKPGNAVDEDWQLVEEHIAWLQSGPETIRKAPLARIALRLEAEARRLREQLGKREEVWAETSIEVRQLRKENERLHQHLSEQCAYSAGMKSGRDEIVAKLARVEAEIVLAKQAGFDSVALIDLDAALSDASAETKSPAESRK